jgi:hypothetical protein
MRDDLARARGAGRLAAIATKAATLIHRRSDYRFQSVREDAIVYCAHYLS